MKPGFVTSLAIFMLTLLLSACASQPSQKEKAMATRLAAERNAMTWENHNSTADRHNKPVESTVDENPLRNRFSVQQRMSLATPKGAIPARISSEKYSFRAKNIDIKSAMQLFARAYKINVFVDPDVTGSISVDFEDLPLKKAMAIILGAHDLYWNWDEGVIRISRQQTRIFVLDYLRQTRTSQISNSTSTSSASSGSSSVASSATGSINTTSTIQQNDNLAFWDELEAQLNVIKSEQGRIIINRLSGTIQVTDQPSRVTEMNNFIDSLQTALHRQVELDARIIEVTLRDDNALGVDWNQISVKGITGFVSNTVANANQGIPLKANTIELSYANDNFQGLINALQEQGSVKVVSQPKIRAMNNQPSIIKVGTDRTFFVQTVYRTTGVAGNSDVYISETPSTVTEGLVLTVTPQISHDRWVMLDISPVITRITDTTISPQGSTAPVLDVKQATTMIRAKDGEMVILGGLIQEEETETERAVPVLGKIPLMGKLFQGSYSTKVKKELVIFLLPRLVI